MKNSREKKNEKTQRQNKIKQMPIIIIIIMMMMMMMIITIIFDIYIAQINMQEDMIKCALHIKTETKITVLTYLQF